MHRLAAALLSVCCSLAAGALSAAAWEPPVTQAMIIDQLRRFDPTYDAMRAHFEGRYEQLQQRLLALQERGAETYCSTQLANEARWLLRRSAHWQRLERQLQQLEVSLVEPDQRFALEQDPSDGSWGPCYEEWFKRLDPMIERLNRLKTQDLAPIHPLDFLQPIAAPDDLIAFLAARRISEPARTGLDGRDELGGVAWTAAQLAFKEPLREFVGRQVEGITIDDAYVVALERFLDDWQDPATGFWGTWYRIDGQLLKSADLSFTYHVVAYRKGKVRHWDRLIETTLRIADQDYPYGWRHRGDHHNHNAYDVVRLIEYGWPHMSARQRDAAAADIEALLEWSLTNSLRPDGSFVTVASFDSSVADAAYYGTSFLSKAGFCSPKRAFWTESQFDEAGHVCCRIAARLEELDGDEPLVLAARERMVYLRGGCPAAEPLTLTGADGSLRAPG